MSNIKVVDLFCGCGGMSWGLKQEGAQIVAGVDNWLPALKTFLRNHPESKALLRDLATFHPSELMQILGLEAGELDCLVGGPPCQGFSKNVPSSYRFFDDPRNLLFRSFIKFVSELRPKVVIIENVAEVYNAFNGRVREEIIDSLNALGYDVTVQVITAADYGVPQLRRRCFFLASRTGVRLRFPEAEFYAVEEIGLWKKRRHRSAWSAISDLPELDDGEGWEPMPYDREPQNDYQVAMRASSRVLYNHLARRLKPTQKERIASLMPGQDMRHLPEGLRAKQGYSGAYGRLDFDSPAPTITRWVFHPGSGRFAHPTQNRVITIREAARIQSFSDDFIFLGTYIQQAHQVGNAVPPLLMRALYPQIELAVTGRLEQTSRAIPLIQQEIC